MAAKSPDGEAVAERLKAWWISPEGQARWATKVHPWTSLQHQLRAKMIESGADPARAEHMSKGLATEIFMAVFHVAPGARKGKNPLGHG